MSFEFSLCLLVVFTLAAFGAPIALSMIVGAIAYLAASGQDIALAGEQIIQGIYGSFILLAVPLFIVAANIMNAGTISERLLNFCVAMVGHLRGGLGHVNVVSSLIFSGMSGSAVADAAGVGKVVIEMMTKGNRYPPGYAAAITAASATIGPIIPPSIPMVIYALVSGVSIGYLFIAGLVPGLFMGVVLMAFNAYQARKLNIKKEPRIPAKEIPKVAWQAFPALMMPAILLYGIYGGVTTPTEAAAVAAGYALLLAATVYRSISFKELVSVFKQSALSSASVGLVISAALIFNYIVSTENIPTVVANTLVAWDLSPLQFMIAVNVLFLLLGCLLDTATVVLVIVPLLIPACRELGIDLIHFGVITLVNLMIGMITPPYGILLFVINGTTRIPLADIIKGVLPFTVVLLFALVIMTVFPDLVLFVPRLFGYAG
ncbi:TRAP transporter large permease [Marinomonas rhizomae]|uniref:TRAP transporter large permease protein n=1 Tax=Marinomonas rhizomae TaxID=491948 RepID=A0A366J050_9GAMM|nr:TRAP transporter large permease [Marinomonas rhizomae]RBP79624.1 tripartite ATP-independent transporter DctM subunit [Marinomonas rhizomae]RNF71620.1 TRAP transporter large permease [Marinomonas rhizomae]